ncbi:MAG TPA: HAD family phosphatase [Blastocatellia bacterium]|nr:HAD family phosphatase [Blastocatellia bacterium]
MLRTIVLDCDGVIADTEPLHLAAFRSVLDAEGITLTEDDYYSRYLALDDRHCFLQVYADRERPLPESELQSLLRRKGENFEPVLRAKLRIFPGVVDFVRLAAERYPLAIASGAVRHEVEAILAHGDIRGCFQELVCAGDTARGKPHPDPFLRALALLNAAEAQPIQPAECLVIEDSIPGIQAALDAGMRSLAVCNSYSREQLRRADLVRDSLVGLSIEELERLFD